MKFEEFAELDNAQKRSFYLSLSWHPFVMSLLDETELNEGYPKADGLRRVGELLLGDIIDSKPIEVFPVNGNSLGRATVSYSITFKWWTIQQGLMQMSLMFSTTGSMAILTMILSYTP